MGRWEGGRRLANFKGPPGLRRGERSLICCHLLSLSRRWRWKSDPNLWLPGARRAPPGPPLPSHGARPTPRASERRWWQDADCTRARARSVPVWESPSIWRTNLAFPRLLPGAKTWGLVGRGGACSHRCSWEPNFPGYLPDLVFPNTQFIFLNGAASFLFSAAFRGQGSSGSLQRLSQGRNSFETWLFTLVPRMGRMHDPGSGGQL